MEKGKAICWLVLGISWLVVVNSGELSSKAGDSLSKEPSLNATVSKVIQALEGDSPYHGDSSQEHSKRGRIFARKGVDMNVTTAAVVVATAAASTTSTTSTPNGATVPKASQAQQLSNVTATGAAKSTPQPQVNSSHPVVAVGEAAVNVTTVAKSNATTASSTANATSSSNPPVVIPSSSSSTVTTSSTTSTTPSTTTTASTTTTTSTTTTRTTTTTTTKPPKKPKITYSVDDEPKLIQAAKPGYNAGSSVSDANGRHFVEEPVAELSKEYLPPALMGPPRGHREYVVPVVTLIFAIPLLMGLFLLSYRRAKEFWLTRHYRRMDFLVDGMYNY